MGLDLLQVLQESATSERKWATEQPSNYLSAETAFEKVFDGGYKFLK